MPRKKNQRKSYKIFITHAWKQYVSSGRVTSPYIRLKKMLNREKGFYWQDFSITSDTPVPGPYRVKKVEEEVCKRMSACDILIVSEAGVYSGGRLWFQREFEIATTKLKSRKPILIVKPRGTRFWAGYYASGADAWATWNQKSIVQGIRCLVDLTPDRRKELQTTGKLCNNCKDGLPALELNRLKGVYCLNCGQVTYSLSGQRPNQAWPDRSRVFWPNDSLYEAWATSSSVRLSKDRTLETNKANATDAKNRAVD